MLDYKGITDNLQTNKIKELLFKLGVKDIVEKNGYLITNTICHNMDAAEASMKLYYYEANHMFYCYRNCESMSIFKFLKHYYETRQIEYDWYEDVYRVAKDCSTFDSHISVVVAPRLKERYIKRERPKTTIYPKSVLSVFQNWYPPEWLNDGISPATMDKFNILFSYTQNKIIIPHYDIDNNLIGIRGRALDPDEIEMVGKYMPVKVEKTWYNHPLSINLYGLNFNWKNIKETGYAFIFEAEKSVLQLESFSQPNCGVAVCGSNFNKYQLNLLLKYCSPKEIIICFDNEEIGTSDKYFNKLWNMCKKYSNYSNFSFVYDIDGLLRQKDSPTDKGEEIFNKLLEKRVHV